MPRHDRTRLLRRHRQHRWNWNLWHPPQWKPGVKGEERALEKMENDYKDQNGVPHANKLKDLARLTLRFTQPAKVVQTLKELRTLGFTIVILKNKYANPTPLGYCACPSRIKAAAPLALLAQTAERLGWYRIPSP